jgi:hypothetical protein
MVAGSFAYVGRFGDEEDFHECFENLSMKIWSVSILFSKISSRAALYKSNNSASVSFDKSAMVLNVNCMPIHLLRIGGWVFYIFIIRLSIIGVVIIIVIFCIYNPIAA